MHSNIYDEWKRPKSKIDIFLDTLAYLILGIPIIFLIFILLIHAPQILCFIMGLIVSVLAMVWAVNRIS